MRIQDFAQYFNFVWAIPVEFITVGGLLVSHSFTLITASSFDIINIWRVGWPGAIGVAFLVIVASYQVHTLQYSATK